MVSVQTWIALVFVIFMSGLLWRYRKRLEVSTILGPFLYFAMVRTTWGLKAMDWMGRKWRKPLRWIGYISIVLGFIGMAFITYQLVYSTVQLFAQPQAAPGIQPVLPFDAKGVFFVPFAYWIISIFIIAVVHEFAHGILARAHDIKVKSSGFAFLGALVPIIPAAFVEPDEKQASKRPARQQLSVFAAGPMANVFMAFLMIFAFGIDASPLVPYEVTQKTAVWDITETGSELVTFTGLRLDNVVEGSPAATAGLQAGDVITSFEEIPVSDRQEIISALTSTQPGQTVSIGVGDQTYRTVLTEHPEDPQQGYLGIGFTAQTAYSETAVAKYGLFGARTIQFMINLIIWVFLLSLGIGLFNLVPLGPIDGGRMLKLGLERLTGNNKHGVKIWKWTSFAVLGMILINLVIGFVR